MLTDRTGIPCMLYSEAAVGCGQIEPLNVQRHWYGQRGILVKTPEKGSYHAHISSYRLARQRKRGKIDGHQHPRETY